MVDVCVEPLIANAGKDISHWFWKDKKEPRTRINPATGEKEPYCPAGDFLHLKESKEESFVPWWMDDEYAIGRLTLKTRKVKLINMLTDHEDVIEVPSEETINEILERYKETNLHAESYTWKRLGRPLDMELRLDENDIPDETEEFERLDIPEDEWYIPAIHLYFNDDLTVK